MQGLSIPVLFSAAMLACTAVQAQEGTQEFVGQVLSTKSRAEVRAELDQARLAGTLERRNYSHLRLTTPVAPTAMAGLTRAAVRAELEQALRSGELDRRNASYGGLEEAVVDPSRGRRGSNRS
jgi:hypothetical protein